MRNQYSSFSFSLLPFCSGAVAVLFVTYIGLIAAVMSYAVLTVEFSQSVRDDESKIAALESEYLARVTHVMNMDYHAAGYTKPLVTLFVRGQSVTAVR